MGCRDSWTELFDVVIAKARKPQFYTSEHPFRFVSYGVIGSFEVFYIFPLIHVLAMWYGTCYLFLT